MKYLGTIVTTQTEAVEADLPDDLPSAEIEELFMKMCMINTTSKRAIVGKMTQYTLLAPIVGPKTEEQTS